MLPLSFPRPEAELQHCTTKGASVSNFQPRSLRVSLAWCVASILTSGRTSTEKAPRSPRLLAPANLLADLLISFWIGQLVKNEEPEWIEIRNGEGEGGILRGSDFERRSSRTLDSCGKKLLRLSSAAPLLKKEGDKGWHYCEMLGQPTAQNCLLLVEAAAAAGAFKEHRFGGQGVRHTRKVRYYEIIHSGDKSAAGQVHAITIIRDGLSLVSTARTETATTPFFYPRSPFYWCWSAAFHLPRVLHHKEVAVVLVAAAAAAAVGAVAAAAAAALLTSAADLPEGKHLHTTPRETN